MINFSSSLLHLTADNLKHNKALLNKYGLYKKRYVYRSLKSSAFDSDYLDGTISKFKQNCSKHFAEAFCDLEKNERYLLAKTLFISKEEYQATCKEIADSVPMLCKGEVQKEVARAALHLLGKVPTSCLVDDSTDGDCEPTFLRLLTLLRKHGAKSLAA